MLQSRSEYKDLIKVIEDEAQLRQVADAFPLGSTVYHRLMTWYGAGIILDHNADDVRSQFGKRNISLELRVQWTFAPPEGEIQWMRINEISKVLRRHLSNSGGIHHKRHMTYELFTGRIAQIDQMVNISDELMAERQRLAAFIERVNAQRSHKDYDEIRKLYREGGQGGSNRWLDWIVKEARSVA